MQVYRTTLSCSLHSEVYGPSTGLPLGAYPSSQLLQTDGRHYQTSLPRLVAEGTTNSRAPWLHGRYSASRLLWTHPTPSRLRPFSRFIRLCGLPSSADSSAGRGGPLQLLDASLSPCCRYHPAGVISLISHSARDPVAFAVNPAARPPGLVRFEATCAFTFVAAR